MSLATSECATLTIDSLTIDDERSFRHVALYADLKEILRKDQYKFLVLPEASKDRWDRALFLNLTFWGASDGRDVLMNQHIFADVVAHVAWHHLAQQVCAPVAGRAASRDALFFGEAVASAFDLYLVGRLLGHAPESLFLEEQVPRMLEAALQAGMSEEKFEALLDRVAADPEQAFEDVRKLLFDVSCMLVECADVHAALRVLQGLESHPYAVLLHHYELSNWVLYAKAYGRAEADPAVRDLDRELRNAKVSLDCLSDRWVMPRLRAG